MIYIFLLVVLRITGKRTLGNMSAFDLVITLMVGHVAAEPILDESMGRTILTVLVLLGLHYLNSYLGFRSTMFNRWSGGTPTILIRNGTISEKALASERIGQDALRSLLRQQQIDDVEDVGTATLEPNGALSVLKAEAAKEAQKSDIDKILKQIR